MASPDIDSTLSMQYSIENIQSPPGAGLLNIIGRFYFCQSEITPFLRFEIVDGLLVLA
jgi:hypothetical protein